MRAVDYSFSRPNPAAITAAGYGAVLRYLGGSASKQLTAAEAAQLHAHGLLVGLVYESTADRAKAGRAAGVLDASRALQAAEKLGYPASCPIFFAVDFDATAAQVTGYFAGVGSVLGARAGIYGGYRVVSAGLASWRWQTKAWSYGHVDPGAHLLQQITMSHPVPGCDEDTVRLPIPLWGPIPKTSTKSTTKKATTKAAKKATKKATAQTVKAPARRVYHNDRHIKHAGGVASDRKAGSMKAAAKGYDWIDNDGELMPADQHDAQHPHKHAKAPVWVNAHGKPYDPAFIPAGKTFGDMPFDEIHAKHPGLRTALKTFQDNAALGLKTEWEAKDLRPFADDDDLEAAFRALAADAKTAYGQHWKKHVEVKVLTNLHGGLSYALSVCQAAHAAGLTTMILPRGAARLQRINKPYITYNRGGRV